MATDGYTDNKNGVQTHNGHLFSCKEKLIMQFTGQWVILEHTVPSKVT